MSEFMCGVIDPVEHNVVQQNCSIKSPFLLGVEQQAQPLCGPFVVKIPQLTTIF